MESDQKNEELHDKTAQYKIGVSTRTLARKHVLSNSTVHRILRNANIKYYKSKKVSDFTLNQAQRAKTAAHRLRRDFFPTSGNMKVVMDDESYFPFKMDSLPTTTGFYASSDAELSSVPTEVRFHGCSKFPMKLMVWVALSVDGLSASFFCLRKHSITSKIYREECISKRLKPFLDRMNPNGNFTFWPDLASAHYATSTIQLLQDLHIPFVPKIANPPNCPQLRPIEDLWACLKAKVYEKGWQASTERQLKQRILNKMKEFDATTFQNLFAKIKSRIRKVADEGVYAVIH